jgi:hypothetical protein
MATPRPYSDLPPMQRLWFLTVTHNNFWQAAQAADTARKFRDPDDIEVRFIATEAAIVRFARPFCRCVVPQVRPHGAPEPPQLSAKLSADFIPADLPGGLSVLRAVLKQRDSLIAHSEIEFKPIRLSRRDSTHASRWKLETLVKDVSDYNLEQLSRVARALAAKAATEADLLADDLFPMVQIGQTALVQFQREGQPPLVP